MPFKIPDTPEELFRQSRDNFSQLNKWIPSFLVLVIFFGILLTSFYSIGPDEVGIIRRFGKYTRTTEPGLHFRLPFNIEKLNKVSVTTVRKEEFGFRTVQPGVRTQYSSRSYHDESLMLTGDLNVLDVTWIVQFKIKDPVQLLFNIRNPRETVRDITESVMREVIGDYSVTDALTTRRIDINLEVQEKLQRILDTYESGVQIVTVKLQDVNPPDKVKPSFNEVNEAKQEKEKLINQSWEAYNKAIPRARGESEKVIREAEGYALRRVNEAKGNAAKFLATWEAYKLAKDVTRRRLYLETLQKVLPRSGGIYVIDPKADGLIPLLRINKERMNSE